MKKILISLLGLSAVSFAGFTTNNNCNNLVKNNLNNNIVNVNKYTVSFVSNGGTLVQAQEVEEGNVATDPSASCTKENYTLDGWFTKNASQSESGTDWGNKFDFATTITADTTLYAKWSSIPAPTLKWYDRFDWWNYTDEATTNDIGRECKVVVNNQIHKVRLIDIDHDVDTNNNKLHTTFEFSNLISDANGDSLAYLWNDTNDTSSANYDYTNSSIRYALTGSGNNNGHGSTILAGVKGNTNWESSYKNKTIYSMLPSAFANKLKTVKKSVGTTSGYTETEYSDKLFMPSTIELGYSSQYDKGFGSTYSYYKNATSSTDASRIKKQVNNSEYTSSSQIPSGSGHAYSGTAYNYAGYNYKADSTGGGIYWLRSPYSSYSYIAWRCYRDGYVFYHYVCYYAGGVAPAFCL